MEMIGFLIVFPAILALVLLCVKNNAARNVIVSVGAAAIAAGTLVLCVTNLGTSGVYLKFSSVGVDYLCLAVSLAIGVIVIGYGVRYKNIWAVVLAAIQLVASLVFEFGFAHTVEVEVGLYFDSLSLLMAFIIGIIGSGICVYALGYMEDFQKQHADQKDRRPLFFAIMFLFLSAMFAIVFSNNMTWMFTAWEVTTVCSFLLIGFTKTDEAIRNAFRQIIMNIAGGIAFVAALYASAIVLGTLSFDEFLAMGQMFPALVVFPLACLAFAGITKAAQMPFHTWLLGAMVAPTPTSALLHSSTMVKAGVFLLVKLSPLFAVSMAPSLMVILVGGITFCLCSFMAISQSNAKRVLAYSTIANLGLIVACAGVGTPEAVWAACFLILFHAIAKSLLFLCVGTAEHHIGSRNIEDMDLLFERMPKLARLMMLGIMGMFIAPFGMLISKWATLVSFADTQQVALLILLAFGSAATFMFWAKWLGKLSGIASKQQDVEISVHKSEWVATGLMAGLLIAACVFLPLISQYCVVPYIQSVFGASVFAAAPVTSSVDLVLNNNLLPVADTTLWLCSLLSIVVFAVIMFGLKRSGKTRKAQVYLSGVSIDNDKRVFQSALSKPIEATERNWYLEDIFGEAKIAPVGTICCTLIIVVVFAIAAVSAAGMM